MIVAVEVLVHVAKDDPVRGHPLAGKHFEDRERMSTARVEMDVDRRPGLSPGAAGGRHDAPFPIGDGIAGADLSDQCRKDSGVIESLGQLNDHLLGQLLDRALLDSIGMRAVNIEPAARHDVKSGPSRDLLKVARTASKPDHG